MMVHDNVIVMVARRRRHACRSDLYVASHTSVMSLAFCKYKVCFSSMAKSSRSSSSTARRSSCPLSCALDVLGDRWSLLLVRDLFLGKTRYGEFAAGPEGIPTNILADRLQRLEQAGIIQSDAYQQNPPRYAYTLTPKGAYLKPVLGALATWSMRHVPRTQADKQLVELL